MKQKFLAWLLGLACSLVLWPHSSLAQDAKRVVVLEFEGPGAGSVRGHVVSGLKERSEVEIVSLKEAESARQTQGSPWGSAQTYQGVGSELGVSAFVEGSVTKAGKRWKATIRVRDASSGLVSKEESWIRTALPKLKSLEDNLWQKLGPAITSSSAPAPKETPKAAPPPKAVTQAPLEEEIRFQEAEEAPEVSASSSEKSANHPALTIFAGPRLMWRVLGYDDQATGLATYENTPNNPAVNAAIGALWFPGAHKRGDWLSDLGLEVDLEYTIGLKSRQNDKEVSTTAYQAALGAVYRLPLDAFEPRFRIGYVKQVFDADVPASTPLPGVSYSGMRFGVGTLLLLTDWLHLDVNLGYLYVWDAGDLSSKTYAPQLATKALDFSGAFVTYIKEIYGISLGADFRRYTYDFGKNPTGMYTLPETGSDHYLRVNLAFVYRIAGVKKSH